MPIAMNDLLDASMDISKPFQVISATEWSQMRKTIRDIYYLGKVTSVKQKYFLRSKNNMYRAFAN